MMPAASRRALRQKQAFGELVARLRLATSVTSERRHWLRAEPFITVGPMSQNELAKRAGVDSAYVNRLERNIGAARASGHEVGRDVALRLGAALGQEGADLDAFLYAAGHAPITDWQTEYQKLRRRTERMEAAIRRLAMALPSEEEE